MQLGVMDLGRWTVMGAIEESSPAEALSAALYARLLSAMRFKVGGHVERPSGG
ncbi:hypothetical protein [Chelativorans sp. YIM 93263]|uniref:hypothetical protein n=1 Tax=Chelativorans sp. YIM 93263 TaxID=2906648 RepID=UPI00403D80EE